MFGRLPWLAAFFFRSRFLRPRLDTTSFLSGLFDLVADYVTMRRDCADRRSPRTRGASWLDNSGRVQGAEFREGGP